MKSLIINLRSKFSDSISTRAAVRNLFKEEYKSYENIIIDFKEIEFISSSSSHQFKLEKDKLASIGITLEYINISNDISRMLDLAKTDRKNIFTLQDVTYHTASNMEEIETLLLEP
jgi:anti-anti-sigma regulatory factor